MSEPVFWWQRRIEGCPVIDPTGSGFWAIPFVVGMLILFRKEVSRKNAIGIMVCVSNLITSGLKQPIPV